MRLLIFIISIFVFVSCDFISPKKTSLQKQKEIDATIDFATVDVYPLFSECKDLNMQQAQIQCFEDNLVNKLHQLVYLKTANTAMTFQDTVYLDLTVSQDYRIRITSMETTPNVEEFLPELDSILRASVSQLPSVLQPAIKRGIPVKSQFKLPVYITVK